MVLFREDPTSHLCHGLQLRGFGGDAGTAGRGMDCGGREIWSADRIWNGPADPLPEEVRFSKPFVLKLHPHSFAVFESQLSDLEPA